MPNRFVYNLISIVLIACLPFAAHWAYGATKVKILDEQAALGLIPLFHLDHSGFQVPEDFHLKLEPTQNASPIFPLFPMFETQMGAQKFIGVKVPAKYLGTKYVKPPEGTRRIVINTVSRSKKENQAARLINSIKLPNGHVLQAHFFRGEVYGISSEYDVSYEDSGTGGLNLRLGDLFSQRRKVYLGDSYSYGAAIRIGGSGPHIGEVGGINGLEQFEDLFSGLSLIAEQDRVEDLIEKTLLFTPYIRTQLALNYQQSMATPLGCDFCSRFPAVRAFDLELPASQKISLPQPVQRTAFSAELQETLGDLETSLSKEVEWRAKVEPSVNATLVWNDRSGNQFIQKICDYLSESYQVPKEIWPRCRIAATILPNAWAYPGGDIFFSAGLLGVLSDLDSLMTVAGHEIGHVVGRHTTQFFPLLQGYVYSANTLGLVSSLFSLGGGFGTMGSVSFISYVPQAIGASQITGIANDLALKVGAAALMGYSRSNEWQSDRFGHQVALSVGSRQEAIHQGWLEFQNYFEKYTNKPKSFWGELLASHPNLQERGKAIEKRHGEIGPMLVSYNRSNRLAISYYEQYKKLHLKFKTPAENYGIALKKKFEEESAKTSSESSSVKYEDYFWNSYLAPGGQCAFHSLSGYSRQ